MRKKSQKTGNFHYNSSTLYIANKTTGHYNFISNIKWAALKKQKRGPRGTDQPQEKKENIVRRIITAITTTLKSTFNYIKLLQTPCKKVPNLKKKHFKFPFSSPGQV